MPGARGTAVLLAFLAMSLAACGYVAATASSAAGTSASAHGGPWQHGYQAGREARRDYFKPGSHEHNLVVYCAEMAYLEVQPVKSSLLQWTEGFNTGCGTRLHPRPRPSGTPARK